MHAIADSASPAGAPSNAGSPADGARLWGSVAVSGDLAALERDWRELEARAIVTPYQSHGWISAFASSVGVAHRLSPSVATVRDAGGRPVAILPFTITRRRGIRFAEFIGGKHANYHMGLFDPGFAAALDADRARALLQDVAAAIGGLDAFVFVNQPVEWNGVANPLAALAAGPSPSRAYKLSLTPGDADGSLRRAMSSHAHKKLKNKRNRFQTFGPSRVVKAAGAAEIERILTAFLVQKARRFAALGLHDPFADPAIREFLRRGATPIGEAPAPIELYALEVEGEPVATYVGAVQGQRFSGMATAFAMSSEIAKSSPGEILLIDLIRLKCSEGITVFDLGVGEARYKTTICDDSDELVDSFLPLTAKGRAFALVARAKRAVKRRIKASPRALAWAQRLSQLLRRTGG